MTVSVIDPLARIPADPVVAALPKADLHVHQEAQMRLERVRARREGRPPYDWRGWGRRLLAGTPPGTARLDAMMDAPPFEKAPDDEPETFVARVTDLLEEEAADGAVLVEVIFGPDAALRPGFGGMLREAERRVRARYPALRAEGVGWLRVSGDALPRAEGQLEAYLRAAGGGLAGVNLRVDPYETEADPALWSAAYRFAERATDAGLGVAAHAAEFSPAGLAAALRIPGVTRVGHAVYAASNPRLLELLAGSGATVECCLSVNVVLGSVPSYAEHPVRALVDAGISVALGTDNPVRVATTVGREYAVAAALGFSPRELLGFTRSAIRASFAPAERREAMLSGLDEWEAESFGGDRR